MSDLTEWLKERRTIYDAATSEWHQGRETDRYEDTREVYSTRKPTANSHDVVRFDRAEDAAFAVDAHNTLPALLTAVEKVLVKLDEWTPEDPCWDEDDGEDMCESCQPLHDLRKAIEGAINEH